MKRQDLTQGSIYGNIFSFATPYVLAYFLQILYGLADLFFIGLYCDVDSTTAVSNGAQVMYFITCVTIGLAMGTTVRTARAIGGKDDKKVARTVGNSITLFACFCVIVMATALSLRNEIIGIMDTPHEAAAGMNSYMTICFLGMPFIMAYNVIAAIFRGMGDSKSPMIFVAIACGVNIVLDYLFIGLLGWGASGAALGTTLSQMTSVTIAIIAIRKHRSMFQMTWNDLKPHRITTVSILKTGIPIALQDGFIQITFLAITVIANGRGLYDAAAVGIVEKFIGLVFIVPSAMLAAVSAISSQNIGANLPERAQSTMWRAMTITTAYGLAVSVILQFVPEVAVRIFTSDANVIELGSQYLRGYVWDCAFAGIHFCFSGYLTACGYAIMSFAHNFISAICARIPLAYLASELYPDTLFPMGLATCVGSVLSCVICLAFYIWLKKRKARDENKADRH